MPNLRTMVTELGTGMGMLGDDDVDEVLAVRSPVMRSLSPDDWDRLSSLRAGGAFDAEFHAAWVNGQAFFAARDGLRGRRPEVVEWKGVVRAGGRRGRPHRPAHRSRLPGELQVHVEHPVQRLPGARLRLPLGRRLRRGAGGAWAETGTRRSPPRTTSVSTTPSARAVRDEADHQGAGTVSEPSRTMAGGPLALPGLEPAPHTDRGDRGTVVSALRRGPAGTPGSRRRSHLGPSRRPAGTAEVRMARRRQGRVPRPLR